MHTAGEGDRLPYAAARRDRGRAGHARASDRRDVLSASTLPILLVAGEKDGLIPAERTFTTDHDNVTRIVIEGAGHMSMMETPEKLGEVISSFMGRLEQE